jgi:hypothetical protein
MRCQSGGCFSINAGLFAQTEIKKKSGSNELDATVSRQLDEMRFGSQPNNSPRALFAAGVINFRDEAGKRLVPFLWIAFHAPTLTGAPGGDYGVFSSGQFPFAIAARRR